MSEEVFVTGLTTMPYDECATEEKGAVSPETYPRKNYKIKLKDIETETTTAIENKSQELQFHNRAQRRAFAKKLGKSGRAKMGTISETAKKLTYINLIEQLRELNEKKGE